MKNWVRWRLENVGGLAWAIVLFVTAAFMFALGNDPRVWCSDCGQLSPLFFVIPVSLFGIVMLVWMP